MKKILFVLLLLISFIADAQKKNATTFANTITAAAIITPSTDPFSLMIVTIPLYALYEASIIIATRINKQQEKETKEWS